ncbi:hypothetical protein BDQ17DRAFT_1437197 [Cyathus striatus]|nr:hypothetical protein BDQ17DRAFT_1437197 [Cyathus striatus]
MPKNTGSVSLSEITLASIFAESLLYGIFISLFISSSTILIGKFRGSTGRIIHQKLLFVSTLMFILGSIHVSADLRRVFEAFIKHRDSETDIEKYLAQVNTTVYLVKTFAVAFQTLVGDAFVLYRLSLVWSGDKRVVYPIATCLIASIGVVIGGLRAFFMASPNDPTFEKELQQWIVSFFSLTLFTNFVSTLLIASRIWWTRYQVRRIQIEINGRSLSPAAMVIVESGAIYSICLIILLALYLSGNYAQHIACDSVAQITGVVFSHVIVRVALGISSDAVTTSGSIMTTSPRDVEGRAGNNSHRQVATDGMIYALKPLNIEVTTVTDMHTDSRD